MFKKLLLLVVTGFFLASCAATNTNQGGDSDASASSSASDGSIVAGTQEDLIVNVGDRVFFEFDSSDLTVDAQATLDAQAAWLMQYPDTNITIEGHADERGTREYNLALGDKRAFAVYSYLAQAGIDTNRMEYISWGKERPEVVGSDETAYSQNRRGVTTVTN
jgi:peptidoglycan-associated lipoprotein